MAAVRSGAVVAAGSFGLPEVCFLGLADKMRQTASRPIAASKPIKCSMKSAAILIVPLLMTSCGKEDYSAAARQCVRESLGDHERAAYVSPAERLEISQRCDASIRHWAFVSTQHAYGAKFDIHNPAVVREYVDRKRAIKRNLLPLRGDSPVD
jgi:hypothetical protein